MRFTRRTYRKAIMRSREQELRYYHAFNRTAWFNQKNHTDRIRARRIRERGK